MRNKVLDAAKAIAAYSIVLLHIRFPGKTGELINALARFAVPFFFLISGYYCFKSREEDVLKKMPGKVRHILLLIGVSYPFYIIWGCIQGTIEGKDVIGWLRNMITPVHIEEFFRYNCSSTVRSHLWFLPALLYCYLIFWLIAKFRVYTFAYFFIPILLVCHLWMDEGRFLFGTTFRVMEFRNYLYTGMPFFLLGHLIHSRQDILTKRISKQNCLILILLGTALTAVEFFQIGRMELYVGSIFLSVGIFLYAVSFSDLKVPGVLEKVGEKYTFSIYVLHPAVREVWKGIVVTAGIKAIHLYAWTKPVVVCILTTIVAAALHKTVTVIRKFS